MDLNIKLSKKQQQAVAAGVLGAGAAIFCYVQFFWLPLSRKTAEVKARILDLEAQIQVAQRQADRLPDLDKELVRLNERKLEAEKRLPKTKSATTILVTLGQLGSKHRVTLLSFSPGPVNKSPQYFIEFRFPVVMRGAFHDIGKFLAALALEQRLYNVLNVNYSEPGEGGDMLVSFELVSYQYKEG